MRTHADNHRAAVLGFGLLVLSGAVVMAAVSGMTLIGYLIGVVQTLGAAAVIVGGRDDADW